ncbi:uncharacterized protein LOC104585200 [Brachypodium distachyon]|uniref:DUF1618 domain-containing protein n=1 Tax=Brachypodium distachyon TaxID=15368 RepID=A0A2K2CTW1_BRADI|nr:uncharacterized protein LOC104585200 [Brachypodium distachyon]PNT65472.1 hypothetical protein BRADI_4g43041v3 [Brachypodium distachyon]PNT65473.1 hypothetical protein BRADI_4g43041v3 [Brachypodium distachyon]|eukprot:XP_010239528.1 uncharacterized protein LOC104585200 [Brachypodium distachyon]
MNRRFLNLVIKNTADCFYSLRRIDPYKHFFYGSTRAALEAADEATNKKETFPAMQTMQLPPPCASFTAATAGGNMAMFALLSPRGTSEGRMVYADSEGEAGLYDADKNSHNILGRLNEPKGMDPVCLSVVHPGDPGQSIMYVLDSCPQESHPGSGIDRCFEVLESVPTAAAALCSDGKSTWWRWRLLPSPPFVLEDGYISTTITSYATKVDGNGYSTIYISAGGIGTYSFETARLDSSHRQGWRRTEKWSRVGEWQLPVTGSAHYVPDFNQWLGFLDSTPHHLCAVNLSAMDHERPPTVQQVWEDVSPPEGEEWLVANINLVNLGGGKFLIAKTFEEGPYSHQFTLLTSIEMIMAGDKSLKMVKHKCARFDLHKESIHWVL